MGGPSNLEEEEDTDQIVQLLGHFGKWQLFLILPIAFFGIMASWEVLVSLSIINLSRFICISQLQCAQLNGIMNNGFNQLMRSIFTKLTRYGTYVKLIILLL